MGECGGSKQKNYPGRICSHWPPERRVHFGTSVLCSRFRSFHAMARREKTFRKAEVRPPVRENATKIREVIDGLCRYTMVHRRLRPHFIKVCLLSRMRRRLRACGRPIQPPALTTSLPPEPHTTPSPQDIYTFVRDNLKKTLIYLLVLCPGFLLYSLSRHKV